MNNSPPTNADMNGTALSAAYIIPGYPPQPCTELLTEDEAIRYLRMGGDPNASRTLHYYREKGVLHGKLLKKYRTEANWRFNTAVFCQLFKRTCM